MGVGVGMEVEISTWTLIWIWIWMLIECGKGFEIGMRGREPGPAARGTTRVGCRHCTQRLATASAVGGKYLHGRAHQTSKYK